MSKLGSNVDKLHLTDSFSLIDESIANSINPFIISKGQTFYNGLVTEDIRETARTALVNLFRTMHEGTHADGIHGPDCIGSRTRASIDIALQSFNRVSGLREITIHEILRGITGR